MGPIAGTSRLVPMATPQFCIEPTWRIAASAWSLFDRDTDPMLK